MRQVGPALLHQHQAIRLRIRQRRQHNALDHAEDSGVGSDAESKREDCGGREARRAKELAQSVAEVLQQGFEERQPALPAVCFFGLRKAAKTVHCGFARLMPVQPVGQIFLCGQVDVRAQLFVEFRVKMLAAEEGCQAA